MEAKQEGNRRSEHPQGLLETSTKGKSNTKRRTHQRSSSRFQKEKENGKRPKVRGNRERESAKREVEGDADQEKGIWRKKGRGIKGVYTVSNDNLKGGKERYDKKGIQVLRKNPPSRRNKGTKKGRGGDRPVKKSERARDAKKPRTEKRERSSEGGMFPASRSCSEIKKGATRRTEKKESGLGGQEAFRKRRDRRKVRWTARPPRTLPGTFPGEEGHDRKRSTEGG